MKNTERFAQIFVALIAALTPILATYVGYKQFQEQVPRKAISISTGSFELSENFSALGTKATFSLKVGDRSFDNLTLVQASIKIAGLSPIADNDIKSPLSVSVGKGWEIVAIEEDQAAVAAGRPGIKWERKSPASFETSVGFLLNPTESAFANVYLSRTDSTSSTTSDPKVKWSMRVLNMPNGPDIHSYSSPTYSEVTYGIFDQLSVFLSFGRMIAVVIVASVSLLAYLQLLVSAGYAHMQSRSSIAHVIASALVSFGFAEALTHTITDMVWPGTGFRPTPVINLLTVVVAATYAVFLYKCRQIESER